MKKCVVSHWKKSYWIERGYSEQESKDIISSIQSKNVAKRVEKSTDEDFKKSSIWCKEYYMIRGSTEKQAIKTIYDIQSKLSSKSKKFLGKHHSDISRKNISENMSKYVQSYGITNWLKHFGDISVYSKSEKEVYDFIKYNICFDIQANFDICGKNVDIIDLKNKKIIEFYGDLWHCNPKFFKKGDIHKIFNHDVNETWVKDDIKIELLKSTGYDVLIIWEHDWKNFQEDCKFIIRKFLL